MSVFVQHTIRVIKQPYVLVVAGALLGISTALPHLMWLTILSLLPFFVLLEQSDYRTIAKHALFFGLGFFGAAYWWFWGVYPLTWIGIENNAISFALLAFAWVITTGVLALTMVLRAVAIRFLSNAHPRLHFLLAAGVWVLFEYVAALTFSIVWAGPQSMTGAHWTFGFLGYAVAEVPVLRSLATIGGVYLLSFTVVLIAALLFIFITQWYTRQRIGHMRTVATVCATLVLFAVIGYTTAISAPEGVKKEVMLLQTAFPSKINILSDAERVLRAHDILDVVDEAVLNGATPNILVFPEGLGALNRVSQSRAIQTLDLLGRDNNTLILSPSNNVQNSEELISSIVYIRARDGVLDVRNKQFLVSVGEYPPYIGIFLTSAVGASEWFNRVYALHGYHSVQDDPRLFKDREVGALQCSEIISPTFYRMLAKDHAILANAASHAAFSDRLMIREQTLKMARLHAVANDRFFIQSGNVAPSFVITNTGSIQSFLVGMGGIEIVHSEVHARATETPYTRFGEWFVYALFVFIFLLIILRRKKFILKGNL